MSNKEYKNFIKGIAITPKGTSESQKAGELEVRSDDNNKLYLHNGTINDAVVQEDVTATLTNKTLTAPVINNQTADTITGIAGGPLLIQSSSNQDLSLQAQGTGEVLLESLSINNTTIDSATDFNINADTNININSNGVGNVYLKKSATNIVRIDSDAASLLDENKVKFYDTDNSNYVGIKSPAVVPADYTITLPANAPDPNTALVYDGTDYKWSTAGGGDASGSNDDILATAFRARILDTFEDQNTASSSSINPTATTASWSSLNQYYSIQYENTTITNGNTTTPTLAVNPAFMAVGDVIIFNNEVRKITVLSPLTINSAFTTASGSCTVSQAVSSKELYGSVFDGASISNAFNNSEFSEFLIDYQDSTTSVYTPNIVPVIGYSVSQNNTSWLDAGVRPIFQTDQIQSGTFASPGTALYVMLFSNVSVGSGTVNLLEYRAYMQKSPIVTTGTLNQAYARFDGSITPQHCTLSTVSGKTQVTLDWTYSNGANNPDTYGAIDVYINGQFIPRQVGSYLTTGAFYKEISSSVIELDTDYSTTPYAIQIVQRQSPSNFVAPAGLSGSTGGSGLKNYITIYKNNPGNGDFETGDTSGWEFVSGVTIDATTKIPSGGSFVSTVTGITNTVISVNQLAANYSLSSAMTTGVSIQGKGIASKAFTIDIEDQAKVLGFKFAYKLASDANAGTANAFNASGTSANTLAVYLHDGTNWIQPAGVYNIVQTNGVGYASGTFQTSSTGTQYRIVILNINTYTTNCTVVFDDFFVGPQISVNAPAISDWQSYIPTFTGLGTPTSIDFNWRRVGDSIELQGKFTVGSSTSTEARISIPSGLTSSDITKIPSLSKVGSFATSYIEAFSGEVLIEPSVTYLTLGKQGSGTAGLQKLNGNSVFGTVGQICSLFARIPISGWSSNSVASNDTDTRVVAMLATGSAPAVAANNPIVFPTVTFDTHGGYNPLTGKYTIPVSGIYRINTYTTANPPLYTATSVYKDNVQQLPVSGSADGNGHIEGSFLFQFNAGNVIDVRLNNTISAPTGSKSAFSLERLSGPAVITSTETVTASYSITTPAATAINTQFNFDTKIFDTHNAVTIGAGVWKFTAPISGKYQISSSIINTGLNNTMAVFKNGSIYRNMGYCITNQATGASIPGTTIVHLNAGEYIDVRSGSNTVTPVAGVFSGATVSNSNFIDIIRLGN